MISEIETTLHAITWQMVYEIKLVPRKIIFKDGWVDHLVLVD
jgi:hypothetical protein